MEEQRIQMFLMNNQKNFDAAQIPIIVDKLKELDNDKFLFVSSAKYKEPSTMLLISLLLGGLGVDRFMLGDISMGVLKLLTGGGFGILTIIDWFTIMDKTRTANFNLFVESIEGQNAIDYFVNNENTIDNNALNSIDEIKKYKELLDNGIITQEEYEKKKAELL